MSDSLQCHADALLNVATRLRREAGCLEALAYELNSLPSATQSTDAELRASTSPSAITVRMSLGLRCELEREAQCHEMSLNTLCIRKLLRSL
jgi:predicted HicB family RNase H-like nuclease